MWKKFNDSIGFRVGDGKRVRFWKDRWCGEEPLAVGTSWGDWLLKFSAHKMDK